MRRSDVVNGALTIKQDKTGTELVIPLHPELVEAIKAGPSRGLHLIGDRSGRPITADRLSALVFAAAKAAALPRQCVPIASARQAYVAWPSTERLLSRLPLCQGISP